MQLNSGDLERLRVFFAIVQANGIANAQGRLNKDASTISRALAQLEERLALRLCERGRQGFALTPEGEAVYARARELFVSLRGFEQTVETVRGVSAGVLQVAIIDNVIADPACPLVPALRTFLQPEADGLEINLAVLSPEEMEKRLLDKRLDIAIGVFESRQELLCYRALYAEQDYLYAAAGHPAAAAHDAEALAGRLCAARFVSRRFLDDAERTLLDLPDRAAVSHATNLEALAALILSGHYLGFMPAHYARPWVEAGAMVALAPERYRRASTLQAVYHRDAHERPIVQRFLGELAGAAAPAREPAEPAM